MQSLNPKVALLRTNNPRVALIMEILYAVKIVCNLFTLIYFLIFICLRIIYGDHSILRGHRPWLETPWGLFSLSVEKHPNNRMLGRCEIVNGKPGKYVWMTYKEVYDLVVKVGNSIRCCGIEKASHNLVKNPFQMRTTSEKGTPLVPADVEGKSKQLWTKIMQLKWEEENFRIEVTPMVIWVEKSLSGNWR
ncbi:unnamed protein product [Fraxinus pennsylvanica]|uniref:Uncharacterized protein n=1 Tax=Fraxinus pennsylvanica TaxID=56036 RepID=A0AAD2A664_9LAMI|nr:unnamed protein product [Fraxinus pennsylvanica]